jgi:hypothetical protein
MVNIQPIKMVILGMVQMALFYPHSKTYNNLGIPRGYPWNSTNIMELLEINGDINECNGST